MGGDSSDLLNKNVQDINCHFVSNTIVPRKKQVLHEQTKLCRTKQEISGRRPCNVRVLLKKRRSLQCTRRSRRPPVTTAGGRRDDDRQMERRVRILKKLIRRRPVAGNYNDNKENYCSAGLDSLFRETADYISALQLRVKVMQVMVDVLSSSPTATAGTDN